MSVLRQKPVGPVIFCKYIGKKQLSEYLSGLQGFCFVLYLGLVYVFMPSTMAQTYTIIITTRGE